MAKKNPPNEVKAGILAHNAAYAKSTAERAQGGEPRELTIQTRRRPDLPEPKMRPPDFLSPLEAMSDIYMRVRGRMSPKTKQLLEGTDLEDMIRMLDELHENEALVRRSEARLAHAIASQLGDDPGPMLLGFQDLRLMELWRLFLDGWEIWTPEGHDERGGVELFWEGEAEDDDGEAMELLQSLVYQRGELVLHAKLGAAEDRITFDGQTFYRLKSPSGMSG